MKRKTLVSIFALCSLLTGCGDKVPEAVIDDLFSARSGVAASSLVSGKAWSFNHSVRPSPSMGIFISSYLAQGAFISVKAAMTGMEAQRRLLEGQSLPATSETFALLQEFGTMLQVDLIDALNRTSDRGKTLDEYINSLKAVGNLSLRKKKELEQQVITLRNEKKEKSGLLRTIQTELRETLRNEDYGRSATLQEEATEAEATLAQTESKLKQAEDILERYEELLEIAEERLIAIGNNREIIIAGLKVVEVPGIEDLGILDESKPFRRRASSGDGGGGEGGTDIFGSQYIKE